jgi:hypothetical protein
VHVLADALEAYRASHVTLQDTVKQLAEEAMRACGHAHEGRLTFEQFCVWAKANPLALDRHAPAPPPAPLGDGDCLRTRVSKRVSE